MPRRDLAVPARMARVAIVAPRARLRFRLQRERALRAARGDVEIFLAIIAIERGGAEPVRAGRHAVDRERPRCAGACLAEERGVRIEERDARAGDRPGVVFDDAAHGLRRGGSCQREPEAKHERPREMDVRQ